MSEPIAITVVRYVCPHCSRGRAKKKAAQAHIARCWYNPAARGCKTCVRYNPGGDACGCEPGCNWGSPGPDPETCKAGRNLTDGLKTGCPEWSPDCICIPEDQHVEPDCPEHGRFRPASLDTP